ncbi:MFS transporter [Thauera sp. 2A1]|uniref:MFS transporter n=1 Tax=Thauera sp. 2A1 TaxID=2570191 RepID=UPI001291746F|nr:MFS transporter [Thauera sp. 2A1]KAI5913283.1 MFS transporter [Thauera sp. 2A1]
MSQGPPVPPQDRRMVLLLIGILLVATNLRAPITGLAPVLSLIQDAFNLSTARAGLLTTLPLLAFALGSPVAPWLAHRFGLERSLFGALVLIAGGVVLRSAGPAWSLFAGTAAIGAGIAVGNVLLPSLLKRDFPSRIATVTGAYALTMGIAAAVASATVYPLATTVGLGWAGALLAMVLLPVAAMLLWWPQLGKPAVGQATAAAQAGSPIWHHALAWQVTLFMGLNSFIYYVMIGWLPAILASLGYSAAEAGSLHGLMQLASAVPGLLLGPLIQRLKDQKLVALVMSLLVAAGLLGLQLLPGLASLWVACFGFGAGACIILALMFMGLRTENPRQAAALSGMAQCAGYTLAAFGPPLIGGLRDLSQGWSAPLAMCVMLSLAMAVVGMLAGRNRRIRTTPGPARQPA